MEKGSLMRPLSLAHLHLLLVVIVIVGGSALRNHVAVEKITDQAVRGGGKPSIDNDIDIVVRRQRCQHRR